jgi:hypothetical protein
LCLSNIRQGVFWIFIKFLGWGYFGITEICGVATE